MTEWPHLMVDVECMGTKSTAALMSIGGVFFDPATLTIGPTFHKPIHIVTSVKLGMQIEPEAVLFWLRQDQAAREAVMFNLLPIEMVLTDFAAWAGEHGRKDGFRIWGNSARFDLGILETAYNLASIKVPWSWGLETCFRTVRNMHAHVEYDPANQKTGIAHSAVDDCIFQIEHLFKIKRYNDGHPEPFEPKARRKKKVRETGRGGTEQTGRARVVKAGGESLKWVSPGMNGVPDQIELYGVDEMMKLMRDTDDGRECYLYDDADLRAFMVRLLAAGIRFTEYKAPGKKPTSNQLRVHERLRARGFTVSVVDTKE